MKYLQGTAYVACILLLIVNVMLFAIFWGDGVQDSQKAKELEKARENCLVLDPHFTDAMILDGTVFCVGDENKIAIPMQLIIDSMGQQ